jgi:hypothetical protein
VVKEIRAITARVAAENFNMVDLPGTPLLIVAPLEMAAHSGGTFALIGPLRI